MDKINVSLYGGKSIFGGKESPLRAEELYCDKYKECSLYKNNCCLRLIPLGGSPCEHGKINSITGYTSRAKKYSSFKTKYKTDEKYNKLKYPSNCLIAKIGEDIYLDVIYTKVLWEKDEYKVKSTQIFSKGVSWIEEEKFNCDLLYKICSFKPYAMNGELIRDYYEKQIPEMLQQLKKLLPELYKEFIIKYPEYDITPNYIDKYAYIKTLVKDSILIDNNGNKLIFDGKYLICDNWKSSFLPFYANTANIKIEVTEDMLYKINDNSQVDENTKFKQ